MLHAPYVTNLIFSTPSAYLFVTYAFSIIAHVIIENLAFSLVENGVIFRYNHLRLIFKMAASRLVDVSEEEMNIMKENAIPRNTKHATKVRSDTFQS